MLSSAPPVLRRGQRGSALLEVLLTVIIMAFGLLGLAGLQGKIQLAESESYQRAQAILLLSDMAERISANRAQATSYVTDAPLGTGDTAGDCNGMANIALRDRCEWSKALQGAGETKASSNTGAMLGARGCVTLIQAQNTSAGVCTPGIYQVTVTWQGLHKTAAPSLACASGQYGDESYRRAIANQITIGLPSCT